MFEDNVEFNDQSLESVTGGNGYVKCMFAGKTNRAYGYIKEYYVPRP